jgi:hypothetical protein
MKKLMLLLGLPMLIISCGEEKAETAPVETPVVEATKTQVTYPYEAQMSNDWTIGNPERIVQILNLYKLMQEANFTDSAALPYFADSLTSVAFDERVYAGSPKGFFENVRRFRSQFKEIDEEFVTYVCLHSESKGIDMVSLWFKEKAERIGGKADSTRYQENWIFNKDGKITHRTAFARYGF